MFDVGGFEILIILLVAFILFGPEKLPHLAVTLAKTIRKIKTGSTSLQRALFTELAFKEESGATKKAFAPSASEPAGEPAPNTLPYPATLYSEDDQMPHMESAYTATAPTLDASDVSSGASPCVSSEAPDASGVIDQHQNTQRPPQGL